MSEHLNFMNQKPSSKFSFSMRIGMFLPILLGLFYIGYDYVRESNNRLEKINQKISAQKIAITNENLSRKSKLEQQSPKIEIDIEKYQRQIPNWSPSLKVLLDYVPRSIIIQSFAGKYEPSKELQIKGISTNYQSIIKFKNSLIDIPYFKRVKLLSSQEKDQGENIEKNYEFEISCVLQ